MTKHKRRAGGRAKYSGRAGEKAAQEAGMRGGRGKRSDNFGLRRDDHDNVGRMLSEQCAGA
eukprot:scaffold50791_cov26-Tisochrysis_lutea.AAC.5